MGRGYLAMPLHDVYRNIDMCPLKGSNGPLSHAMWRSSILFTAGGWACTDTGHDCLQVSFFASSTFSREADAAAQARVEGSKP